MTRGKRQKSKDRKVGKHQEGKKAGNRTSDTSNPHAPLCVATRHRGTETVAARQQPPTVFATAVGGFRDTELQRGRAGAHATLEWELCVAVLRSSRGRVPARSRRRS
jgi:hypothetical protein